MLDVLAKTIRHMQRLGTSAHLTMGLKKKTLPRYDNIRLVITNSVYALDTYIRMGYPILPRTDPQFG